MATCNDCIHSDVCYVINAKIAPADTPCDECTKFKEKSKFVELPCKVGDYFEWDNGAGSLFYFEITGFEFNPTGKVIRYITNDVLSPIVSHRAIKRILTREEVEKALKERELKNETANNR